MKFTNSLFALSISALLFSCATEIPPSGGPKDVEEPQFLIHKSLPDSSHRTNFTGKEITLKFNEVIDVHNFNQNFQSNPKLNTPPKYKVKKNELHLTIQDTLTSNTTYIFTINNCIQDITEKNKIENFSFAFSTGDQMDSLELTGTILDEYTNQPGQNYQVGLYNNHDSIDPFIHDPIYTTSSNKHGNFEFTHLKGNNYKVIAFGKPSKGSKPQYPSKLAFTEVQLDSSTHLNDNMNVFNQDEDTLYLKHLSQKDGYIRCKLNKQLTLNNNFLSNEEEDQLNIFPKTNDSSVFNIKLTDRYNNTIDTTIVHQPLLDTVDNKISSSFLQIDNNIELVISSQYPIKYNIDSLQLLINNSDTISFPINQNSYFVKDTLIIRNKKYTDIKLLSDTNCYISTYIIDNQYFNKSKSLLTEEKSSILRGRIVSDQSNFIFELLNSKGQIIRTLRNEKTIYFTFLSPEIYTYRIILDEDANKKHSEGDYFRSKQAENVISSTSDIILKANWEIDNLEIIIP